MGYQLFDKNTGQIIVEKENLDEIDDITSKCADYEDMYRAMGDRDCLIKLKTSNPDIHDEIIYEPFYKGDRKKYGKRLLEIVNEINEKNKKIYPNVDNTNTEFWIANMSSINFRKMLTIYNITKTEQINDNANVKEIK